VPCPPRKPMKQNYHKPGSRRKGTGEAERRDPRRFVQSRLADLQTLFGAEAVTIRAEIAKCVQKITFTPEGRTYVAGTWDLLGAAAWDGAGGAART
jgi:hypothetical protein